MKTNFLFVFSFLALPVFGQNADSLAVAQEVDSLIQVSRTLTGQQAFDKALEVNVAAEKMALDRFGRESVAYGSCCFNRGIIVNNQGNYQEAEKWYLDSKAIWEKNLGKEHPNYAHSLNNLAILYLRMGNYEKSEQFNLEAKAIREKTLGKEHPDYAASIGNLANLYQQMGDYEKTEQLSLEAKAIFEKTLGKEHPHYAQTLSDLAMLYLQMGNYEQSEQFNLEAKAIREKTLGKEHPYYAHSLSNLAMLYQDMGNYDQAEQLYLEAKAIREKTLGKEHPDYAASLLNLATVYQTIGNYKKAEMLYLEAKAIDEKTLGKEHPYYAQSLHNLGDLYHVMGHYDQAEMLYLEAKAIEEKTLGKEHPDYAGSLLNLASLYREMGNYEISEQFNLEAKAIQEKTLGKAHPGFAETLRNLANMYQDMGHYDQAESLYLEAKDIDEKTFGKEHPNYASSLHSLAMLYQAMGHYDQAEMLYLEVKTIDEKTLGKEHPEHAVILYNLAMLYQDMGNYEKSKLLHLEAKAIWEKNLGKEHPRYANSLHSLAMLYQDMGNYDQAEHLYLELFAVNEFQMSVALNFLSERELASYLNQFSESQYNTLFFAQQSGSVKIVPLCYDNVLFYKGFLLQAAGRIKHMALSDNAATEKFDRLKGYHRRLAAEYAKPLAERSAVSELEEKANDLEKELARTVANYADAMRQVRWQEVQSALKQNEAAIEFVHFRATLPKNTHSTMYAALVLSPNDQNPRFIPLFEQKQLDSLLHTTGERKADYVNALYTIPERGTKPLGKPKKSLYELLWQPLEKHLAGVKTIYYSPAGLLHRINIAAIPINLDSVLADHYHLVELGSTRSRVLGIIPTTIQPAANDAALFGGVQYDSDSTAIAQANAALDSISFASRGELSFTYTDSTLRVGTWSDLPFTDREITGIGRIMQTAGIETQTRRGYSATEETFKSIGAGKKPSPRILHIATHGFFFPDPVSAGSKQLAIGGDEPVFKISDHPMIRSGLILAGGNHAWQTGKPIKPGLEDGILTAYEISQMNLSNTELVVLSACETGLGDIQGNEGVYGLQRAFKIAGAKYLIMSLWQVPDKQTSLLMTTFYKRWLEEKMTIPEAFRAAQRELREAGLDPYYWAGFVLVE